MFKFRKALALFISFILALGLANFGSLAASAAVVSVTLTNPTPVNDITTGQSVPLAGVVGDSITIVSSSPFSGTLTVDFNGASAIATPLVAANSYTVKIPTGAKTGTVSLSDDGSANTATVPGFQIWPSRSEPWVMPSGHLNITYTDLQYILDQIKIGEAHAARTQVSGATVAGRYLNQRAAGTSPIFPYDVTSANRCLTANDVTAAATTTYGPTSLSNSYVFANVDSWGIRQVDGRCNNITTVLAETAPAGSYNFPSMSNDTAGWGATDEYFTRLAPAANKPVTPYDLNDSQKAYQDPAKSVLDPQPRTISNLISDQSINNPAAVAAGTDANGILYGQSGYESENAINATTGKTSTSVKIPNITADYNVSAGYDSWFTWFGQFFDHGLDLIPKAGASVLIPLDQSDPVYVPSANTNFMVLTRGSDANGESINSTSPYIDQSQSYGSHPSQNFFVREYSFAAGTGVPSSNGRLLESTEERYSTLPSAWAGNLFIGGTLTHPNGSAESANGGMPTWRDIKAQTLLLGFKLTDNDASSVPVMATDQYGKFIPSSTGFPQMLYTDGTQFVWASGNPSAPLTTGVATYNTARGITLPGRTGSSWVAVSSGHNFINDTMSTAVPSARNGSPLTPDADGIVNAIGSEPNGYYDDESLAIHLVAGDGRINENIGLEAVHAVFHSEHNTVLTDIVDELNNNPVITASFKAEFSGANAGERLYQAARFVMEMEYQHMAFDEFVRRISPSLPVFLAYDETINPGITAEFASAVYRLGHSMVTETIPRSNPGQYYDPNNNQDVSLIDGFTNPSQGRLQRPMTVLSASQTGSSITYTLKSGETAPLVGQIVSVTNLTNAALNVANAIVASRDSAAGTFTVNSYYAGGASASATSISSVGSTVTTTSKTAETDGSALALVKVSDPGSNPWTYTVGQQTSMLVQGLTAQRGQEVDEFVTDSVRNNLLGLPLDLAALNITRGRDVGLPTLNQFRSQTGGTLTPYHDWNDYFDALRYFTSEVNFLAAYGKFPTINAPVEIVAPTSATSNGSTIVYTANDTSKIVAGDIVTVTGFATLNVNFAVVDSVTSTTFTVSKAWANSPSATLAFSNAGALMSYRAMAINPAVATETADAAVVTREPNNDERRAAAQAVLEAEASETHDALNAVDFLNGAGYWATHETGINDVDLWVGGLAENPYKQPIIPPVLGPTFQYVFEDQMLKLQNGDRFYYLGRLAGTNLGEEIPAQKFTDIIRRNTPSASAQIPSASASGIVGVQSPGFSVSDCAFSNVTSLVPTVLRCAASTLRIDSMGVLLHRGLDNITAFADISSFLGARIGGGAGDDSIQGTNGNDLLSGGLSGGDTIDAYGGNDIVIGGAGEDLLKGGPGADDINAGESQLGDIADGGSGQDFIHNSNATGPVTSMMGEAGDDMIQGGKNTDLVLQGGEGNDWIEGLAGLDFLFGDSFLLAGVFDAVRGGNDVIIGGAQADSIWGNGGDDIINVGDGVDAILAGAGFDWINYEGVKRYDNGGTSRPSAFADLSGVNPNVLNAPADAIADAEGISGGPGNDVLIGTIGADVSIANARGTAGATFITLPGAVTNIVSGMLVTGTGIGQQAVTIGAGGVAVVNGVTTTTVDLTAPNSGTVSGTVKFSTFPINAPTNISGLTQILSGTPGWTKYSSVTPGATKWSGGTIMFGGAGNNSIQIVAGENVVHGSAQLHTCIYAAKAGVEFNTGADVKCATGRGYSTMSLISKYLDSGVLQASDLTQVREIVGTNVDVTGSMSNGTSITFTAANSFIRGDIVNVTGLSNNCAFNVKGATVTSATATTFTVASTVPATPFAAEAGKAGFYNTLMVPYNPNSATIARITGTLPAGALSGYTLTTATGVDYAYDITNVVFANGQTRELVPWVCTLSRLTSSTGTFSPGFSSVVTNYQVTVAATATTVTVTPTATDAAETITVNGTPVVSGSASLAITLSTTATTLVTVVSTSADGRTSSTYRLTYIRQGATPSLSRPAQIATGVSSSITNWNSAYTYSITSSAGAVRLGTASGTTLPFTVVGLYGGQTVTITVTATRSGYTTTSASVNATAATSVALVPLFDSPVATKTGFTVNVTNYQNTYTWTCSVTAGYTCTKGTAVGSTLPITVSGPLVSGQSPVLTVTTTKTGSTTGSSTVTAVTIATAQVGSAKLLKARTTTKTKLVKSKLSLRKI
ncbi:MAG: peroxidase family protein [Micrococcales bacterium]